jgi:shikimate kinase
MTRNRIIYIIGFMGSGKSTTGRKLASLLGWSFRDLDREIETHDGRKIPEIFAQDGEEYFRAMESEVLRDLDTVSDTIISTGGGTPCHSNNMDHMLSAGITVYLRLTPLQLKNRLLHSNTERPLIKDLDNESILDFIEKKLVEREPWYKRADIIISGFDTDITALNRLIISRLDTW